MSYDFGEFLEGLHGNWYEDDALLQKLMSRYAGGNAQAAELSTLGREVAGSLKSLAEESARPENRPYLVHFDAYGRRVDQIVLPASTQAAFAVVAGRHHLGGLHGDPFGFYAKGYLCAQNGEAGTGCSLACTDGFVRAIEALGDRPVHREAVDRVRASTPERVWHGAQFVTEIQGGSDVPANTVEAIPDGNHYRLRGQKWFCSNINADWFLVTARPTGAPPGGDGVALFLVPAFCTPGDWRRNGYTIDRLKDKLGTRELATAEVTFSDAIAYPLGALDRGIPNLLRYVLVTSRFACASSAAAALRQAERVVTTYARFRNAFGQRLERYPLVREALVGIREARAQTLAAIFELCRLWHSPGTVEALDFRIMMSLAKPVLTRRATEMLHEAMMLLAGNGIEERFSILPRLYRDAVIMETWEGPHFVLFSQALRDLVRYEVDPDAFVRRIAGELRAEMAEELGKIIRNARNGDGATVAFSRFAPRLVEAMGERVLSELG